MCVHAKPDITKDLIEADDIGRKAVADFTDSLLIENMSFTTPLNATSLKNFGGLRGQEEIVQFKNLISQISAKKRVFGQHDLRSIGQNFDLELILPVHLGPAPRSLTIPDGITIKTDEFKLLHVLQ